MYLDASSRAWPQFKTVLEIADVGHESPSPHSHQSLSRRGRLLVAQAGACATSASYRLVTVSDPVWTYSTSTRTVPPSQHPPARSGRVEHASLCTGASAWRPVINVVGKPVGANGPKLLKPPARTKVSTVGMGTEGSSGLCRDRARCRREAAAGT